MKNVSRLLLATTAIAALALGSLPAHAASGIGTVNGVVTTSPGISTTPAHQTIGFSSIIISGVFNSDDNAAQFIGTITVRDVTAQTTGSEDTSMGTGTINFFTFAGAATAGSDLSNGACGTSGVTGSAGSYQRFGGVVLVTLNCKASIGGHTFGGSVTLESLYIPTAGDGVTSPVTAASFDGTYQVS